MTTTSLRPHTTATIQPAEPVRMRAEDPALHVIGLTFSAVTITCAMAMALARPPYDRGASRDVGAVLDQLATTESSTRTGAWP